MAALPLPAGEELFLPDSKWETVTEGHQFAEGMDFDADGNLLFTDVPRMQLFRIDRESGKRVLLDGDTGRANGISFGPDGRLYGCASGAQAIHAWDPASENFAKTAVARGTASNDLAILDDGTIYYTDPKAETIWRVSPGPERTLEKAAALPWRPNGIGAAPDGTTLFVAEFASSNVHGFPINEDRSLGESAVAYILKVPPDGSGKLDGLMVLPGGRLLIGTALGVQLAHPHPAEDPPLVVPPPGERPRCNYVRISPDGRYLYAAFAADILRRRLDTVALFPGE